MTHFATITQTRHGWRATFSKRLPRAADWVTMELTATRWRRSRAGIERAADRFLRRLNTDERRETAAYEYTADDRPKSDWVAPRNGGYSARRTGEPRPTATPPGRGSASRAD